MNPNRRDDPTIVVIRPFRPQDNEAVQRLIYRSTMSMVTRFFKESLVREIYFQALILTAAIMFILLGVPFYWTLTSIPLVTIIFYSVIFGCHYQRARYHTSDLKDILTTYLSSNKTCFLVAEAFGPLPPQGTIGSSKSTVSSLAFVSFAEFEKMDWNQTYSGMKQREIIGTIGVLRDKNSAVIAWVRRLTVAKAWRGRGVGSNLMDTVIKFCNSRSFVAVELVTTECHQGARGLMEGKGFEPRQLYHKKYFFLNSLTIGMQFMSLKTRPVSSRSTTFDL